MISHKALCLCLSLSFCCHAAERISWATGPTATEIAVVIPGHSFTEHNVLAQCRAFLRSHRKYSLLKFAIFTDARDGMSFLHARGSTDWDPGGWLQAYQEADKTPPSAAEMIGIGHSAVVRIWNRNGQIRHIVLSGSDCLRFQTRAGVAKLRWINFRLTDYRGGWPDQVSVFFQMSSPPTVPIARELLHQFRSASKFKNNIDVTVENEPWFSTSTDYPIYNRFVPRKPTPTLKEASSYISVFCSTDDGGCIRFPPK